VNTSLPSSHPTLPYLPFKRVSLTTAGWAVGIGMALVLPASYAIHYLLPLPAASAIQVATKAKLLAATPLWLLALKSLLLYPVLEECFYRGVILQMLRRYLPLWAALLPPTLLFGVTHLGSSPTNAVFAAIAGLCFAWFAIRSGSLLTAILCHSAVNLFVVFLLPFAVSLLGAREAGAAPLTLAHPLPLALLAVSVPVLVAGTRKLRAALPSPAAPVSTAAPVPVPAV
jgi:membrane protease YdiL (CAAX protease family)